MVYLKFHDKCLDAASMQTAKRNLGETEESKHKGLHALKEMLRGIENFNPRTDENFLLRFLRVAKFDVQKAFDRLCSYYKSHMKYPHIFDECYPSAAFTVKPGYVWGSPYRVEDNSILVINKRGFCDPSTMIYDHFFLYDALLLDHVLENEVTQLCGLTAILDYSGYSYKHFLQDSPRRVKRSVDCFQNTYPVRYNNIHIINAPAIFPILLKMAYPFFSKKLKSRLHIHDSNADLLSVLPADILPEEYGGNVPKSDLVDIISEVIKKEEYYRDQLQYGYGKATKVQ